MLAKNLLITAELLCAVNAQWWQWHSGPAAEQSWDCKKNPFKHVITFSIDGFHSSDVEKYLAVRPNSNMSQLLAHGYEYTDAWTSAPSDSYPGTLAQFTGAGPVTTGLWYDDVWVRDEYYPSSGCVGPAGAEGKQYLLGSKSFKTFRPNCILTSYSHQR